MSIRSCLALRELVFSCPCLSLLQGVMTVGKSHSDRGLWNQGLAETRSQCGCQTSSGLVLNLLLIWGRGKQEMKLP